MSERNVEIVRTALDALNRQDLEAALACFDPEVEMDWSRRLLDPEVLHGHEGVRETIEGMLEVFADFQLEEEEVIDLGDEVLFVVSAHFRGRESGAEVTARAATVWTIRDGRIVRFRFFQGKEDALEEIGARDAGG
jgi:ketosteroid isomerase-like protein